MMDFRVTYDPEADAAYLYLTKNSEPPVRQISGIALPDMLGEVEMDLASSGRIIGIEFVNASEILPKELINRMQESASSPDSIADTEQNLRQLTQKKQTKSRKH